MADEKKTQQINPDDESKKDTVRINLPPGLTGKTASPATSGPATIKLKPAVPGATSEDEAKKETAVMGRPAETPKPKSDTSRVQVTGSKPGIPETPRPTVKLKQAEPPAPVRPAAPSQAPAVVAGGVSAEPSGALAGLSLAAMVLSVVTAAYLAMLAFG